MELMENCQFIDLVAWAYVKGARMERREMLRYEANRIWNYKHNNVDKSFYLIQ